MFKNIFGHEIHKSFWVYKKKIWVKDDCKVFGILLTLKIVTQQILIVHLLRTWHDDVKVISVNTGNIPRVYATPLK